MSTIDGKVPGRQRFFCFCAGSIAKRCCILAVFIWVLTGFTGCHFHGHGPHAQVEIEVEGHEGHHHYDHEGHWVPPGHRK